MTLGAPFKLYISIFQSYNAGLKLEVSIPNLDSHPRAYNFVKDPKFSNIVLSTRQSSQTSLGDRGEMPKLKPVLTLETTNHRNLADAKYM